MATAPHSSMPAEDIARRGEPAGKDEVIVDETSLESFPASDAPAWTETHAGAPVVELPPVDTPRELRSRLRADVDALAKGAARADHIASALLDAGRSVTRMPLPGAGDVENLEAVVRGVEDGDEVVVAAHYAARGPLSPTDASATAVLLGLARLLTGRRFARTVRLVALASKPGDGEPARGSRAYAQRLADNRVRLRGMIALESVAFAARRHEPGKAPLPMRLVPAWTGEFAAFVGDKRSKVLLDEVRDAFRQGTELPARTLALPRLLPFLASADHRAFARHGYPALLVSDVGPLPRRASGAGGLDDLGYDCMADFVFGLASVIARLAGGEGRH